MREPYHKLEDKLVGSDNRMNIRYSDIRNSKHQQQVFDRQGMRKPYRITGDYKRSFWVSNGKLKKFMINMIGCRWVDIHRYFVHLSPDWLMRQIEYYFKYEVCHHWEIIDGRIHAVQHRSRLLTRRQYMFYVDVDGLLQLSPMKEKHEYPHPLKEIESGNKRLFLRGGVWWKQFVFPVRWELDFMYNEEGELLRGYRQKSSSTKTFFSTPTVPKNNDFHKHTTKAQQCNRRDLRKFKIQNMKSL